MRSRRLRLASSHDHVESCGSCMIPWTVRQVLEVWRVDGRERTVTVRTSSARSRMILSTGCQWVAPSKHLPPGSTVDSCFLRAGAGSWAGGRRSGPKVSAAEHVAGARRGGRQAATSRHRHSLACRLQGAVEIGTAQRVVLNAGSATAVIPVDLGSGLPITARR